MCIRDRFYTTLAAVGKYGDANIDGLTEESSDAELAAKQITRSSLLPNCMARSNFSLTSVKVGCGSAVVLSLIHIFPNLPYLLFVYLFDKLCQAVRLAPGLDASEKFLHLSQGFTCLLYTSTTFRLGVRRTIS